MKRHQVPSVGFDEEGLFLLDQRLLPREQKYLCVKSAQEAVEAIRSMVVRGAPAIGVTAAFALAQEARRFRDLPARELLAQLEEAASALRQARPTAVNLAWAVNRVMAAAQEIGTAEGAAAMAGVVEAEAQAIYAENLEMDRAIARHALELIPAGARILTHCNAGALATAGFGTAVGAIVYAHEQGRDITVWVDETRPLLQGARLTAWELGQAGVPYRLITDNMAGYFMSRGE
ncbi:MAG TPA: S-methyl-5-thioribose-1-phosphate isomerase, partial [Firmicutes bacterium]|nr:S-methyl-5-thioribose-1-phosphate isomerase [Bacillota bacterium]